jgi:predicted dehydrogenase
VVVGLVGCGNWGRHILRDLIALGCEVPVVARSDASRRRARDGGAAAIVPDVALLPEIDGVVVATSTTAHAAAVEALLERDIPVFCEKPLTCDPASAQRLAGLAPDRLFVMDKWRYHPGVAELAAIASERRLGAVAGLVTRRVGWGSIHDDADAAWVLAPHDLSIALEVFGALGRPRAAAGHWFGDALEHLNAVLHGDGWWHALEVSSRSPERRRSFELHCDDGVAVLSDGWATHVSIFHERDGGAEEERVAAGGELPLLAELRAFVEHLRAGPPPRSSAAEGGAVVSAIAELRALASAT